MATKLELTSVETTLIVRIRQCGADAIGAMFLVATDIVAYLRTASSDRAKAWKLVAQSETGLSRSLLDKWCATARQVSRTTIDRYVVGSAYPPMAIGTLHSIAGKFDGQDGHWAADGVIAAMQTMAQERGSRWTESAAKAPLGSLSDVEGLRKRAAALGAVEGLGEALERLTGDYGPAEVLVVWMLVAAAEDRLAASKAKEEQSNRDAAAPGGDVTPTQDRPAEDGALRELSASLSRAEETVQRQRRALDVACRLLFAAGRINSPSVELFIGQVTNGLLDEKQQSAAGQAERRQRKAKVA